METDRSWHQDVIFNCLPENTFKLNILYISQQWSISFTTVNANAIDNEFSQIHLKQTTGRNVFIAQSENNKCGIDANSKKRN